MLCCAALRCAARCGGKDDYLLADWADPAGGGRSRREVETILGSNLEPTPAPTTCRSPPSLAAPRRAREPWIRSMTMHRMESSGRRKPPAAPKITLVGTRWTAYLHEKGCGFAEAPRSGKRMRSEESEGYQRMQESFYNSRKEEGSAAALPDLSYELLGHLTRHIQPAGKPQPSIRPAKLPLAPGRSLAWPKSKL